MESSFLPKVSIEEFAAYLDNNLVPADMEHISAVIENDQMLSELAHTSQMVDEMMNNIVLSDWQLPENITSSDFTLPDLKGIESFSDIGLEDLSMVACGDVPLSLDDEQYKSDVLDTDTESLEQSSFPISDGIDTDPNDFSNHELSNSDGYDLPDPNNIE